MHYEVELGLIMGKTVRDLDPEDTKGAMDAIEGMNLIESLFCAHFLAIKLITKYRLPPRHRHDRPKCPG
jgi:hypothetical protein